MQKRLAEYGVPVRSFRYNGVMHGFISFYEVMYRGNHGLTQTAAFLNQAFEEGIEYELYVKSIRRYERLDNAT